MSKISHKKFKKALLSADLQIAKRHEQLEKSGSSQEGGLYRQIILGGQDGVVNVLGIVLGVASATSDTKVVLIAGLAATFAESISMAAVAYTSARAAEDYYKSQLEREKFEIKAVPDIETKEIELIYYKKGFRGKALERIVRHIISDKKLWLETMMKEELGLYESEFTNPSREAMVVGVASFIGSLVPLIPFFLLPIFWAIAASIIISLLVLGIGGALKPQMTTGKWYAGAFEMMLVGGIAAIAGWLIGGWVGQIL